MTLEAKCRKLVREWRKSATEPSGYWVWQSSVASQLEAILPKKHKRKKREIVRYAKRKAKK